MGGRGFRFRGRADEPLFRGRDVGKKVFEEFLVGPVLEAKSVWVLRRPRETEHAESEDASDPVVAVDVRRRELEREDGRKVRIESSV